LAIGIYLIIGAWCLVIILKITDTKWSPTGKARGPLSNATWGDIPRLSSGQAGHTMAHSSTAKGRGLLLPE
jgi:hypothetical protein